MVSMRLNLVRILRERRERKRRRSAICDELRKYKQTRIHRPFHPEWDGNRMSNERGYDEAIRGLIVKYEWTNDRIDEYKDNHGRVGLMVKYEKLEKGLDESQNPQPFLGENI
jgi:hypothetical protein